MVIAQLKSGDAPAKVVLEIVRRLEKGQVLLLPTDTVYGLHALARNADAVRRIRRIKGLPEDQPLVNLYSSVVGLARFVQLPEGVAKRKILESWPGSVTWVLPAQDGVPKHILSEDGALGVRIPDSQLLRSVCSALDDLVVSTSANRHRNPPASLRSELDPEIVAEVDAAVYQTEALPGHPSEVKRWTPAGPEVIRTRDSAPAKSPRLNILVVCSGNICRSPMAEAMLRHRLREQAGERFIIRSAGTISEEGFPPQLPAIQAMQRRGIDIGSHRSRPVTKELMEWADVVLVMTTDHLGELHERFPDLTQKSFLITAFPGMEIEGLYGVEDPFGSSPEAYEMVAHELEQEVERIVQHLLARLEEQ